MFKEGDKVRIVKGLRKILGLTAGDIVTVVSVDPKNPLNVLVETPYLGVHTCRGWFDLCDLEPIAEQTLFEAAKDAPDGTRFSMGVNIAVKKVHPMGDWSLYMEDTNLAVLTYHLTRTDFEIIPSDPKKRKSESTHKCTVKLPDDRTGNQWWDACELIGRLMRWEGAQIGEPGYVMTNNTKRWYAAHTEYVLPYRVTFRTEEQCEAAWRAECPELFE